MLSSFIIETLTSPLRRLVRERFTPTSLRLQERDPSVKSDSTRSLQPLLLQPLPLPIIQRFADLTQRLVSYDQQIAYLERTAKRLSRQPTDEVIVYHHSPTKPPSITPADILSATKQLIERAAHPPLLPAPPPFEEAFARYEAMFHTVFYRRYPYAYLADAKQDALIHLWKSWKKDMSLLEQSAAYVVQAAIWGASPHRKIQKAALVQQRELPLPQYERYIDIRVADQSRDPAWIRAVDMRVDLQHAVAQIASELETQPNAQAHLNVLGDILKGRPLKEGRKGTTLSTRGYQKSRAALLEKLRLALKDYAPNSP